jgi:hypothetical protein
MLESLDKGKAEGLFQLYNQEAGVRGNNAWLCTLPSQTMQAMLMSVMVSSCVTLAGY